MVPTREMIDELYREQVEDARRMTPEQKLLAGAELFDLATQFTLAGIRAENPGASEDEVQSKLRDRLKLVRRLENRV